MRSMPDRRMADAVPYPARQMTTDARCADVGSKGKPFPRNASRARATVRLCWRPPGRPGPDRQGFLCRRTIDRRTRATHGSPTAQCCGCSLPLLFSAVAVLCRICTNQSPSPTRDDVTHSILGHLVKINGGAGVSSGLRDALGTHSRNQIRASTREINPGIAPDHQSGASIRDQSCGADDRRRTEATDSRVRQRRHRPNPPSSTAVRSSTRSQ